MKGTCMYLCAESQMLHELGGLEPAHGWNLQAQLLPAVCGRGDKDRRAELRGMHVPELAGLHAFACSRRCAERQQSPLQGLEVHVLTFRMIYISPDALQRSLLRYEGAYHHHKEDKRVPSPYTPITSTSSVLPATGKAVPY